MNKNSSKHMEAAAIADGLYSNVSNTVVSKELLEFRKARALYERCFRLLLRAEEKYRNSLK